MLSGLRPPAPVILSGGYVFEPIGEIVGRRSHWSGLGGRLIGRFRGFFLILGNGSDRGGFSGYEGCGLLRSRSEPFGEIVRRRFWGLGCERKIFQCRNGFIGWRIEFRRSRELFFRLLRDFGDSNAFEPVGEIVRFLRDSGLRFNRLVVGFDFWLDALLGNFGLVTERIGFRSASTERGCGRGFFGCGFFGHSAIRRFPRDGRSTRKPGRKGYFRFGRRSGSRERRFANLGIFSNLGFTTGSLSANRSEGIEFGDFWGLGARRGSFRSEGAFLCGRIERRTFQPCREGCLGLNRSGCRRRLG